MNRHKWKIVLAIGVVWTIAGVYLLLRSISGKDSVPVGSARAPDTARSQVDALHDTLNMGAAVAPVKSADDPAAYREHETDSSSKGQRDIDAQLDEEEETARQEAHRKATGIADRQIGDMKSLLELLKVPSNRVNTEIKKTLEDAIKDLAALGDKVIPPMMSEFNREDQSFVFRHRVVMALQEMRSPQARDILLDIALGKTEATRRSMKMWAARAYIKVIDDRSEAKGLLASTDDGVQNIGLVAMAGQRLDTDLVTSLGQLIRSEHSAVRWGVARVMAAEPSNQFAREKVSLLMDAIRDLDRWPGGQNTLPGYLYTNAEVDCHEYVRALVKMDGSLKPMQEYSSNLTETAKEAIAIARAAKGDIAVKGDVLSIVRGSKNRLLRVLAIGSVGEIGTPGDIPLLRQIAETDALVEERQMGVGSEGTRKFYPGRVAASRAIKQIENRQQK